MIGSRVKLSYIFDMAPMVVHAMVGNEGVVKEKSHKIISRFWKGKKIETKTSVWLVVFDDGKRLWVEKKYLDIVE